jgi:hypothetical protein
MSASAALMAVAQGKGNTAFFIMQPRSIRWLSIFDERERYSSEMSLLKRYLNWLFLQKQSPIDMKRRLKSGALNAISKMWTSRQAGYRL